MRRFSTSMPAALLASLAWGWLCASAYTADANLAIDVAPLAHVWASPPIMFSQRVADGSVLTAADPISAPNTYDRRLALRFSTPIRARMIRIAMLPAWAQVRVDLDGDRTSETVVVQNDGNCIVEMTLASPGLARIAYPGTLGSDVSVVFRENGDALPTGLSPMTTYYAHAIGDGNWWLYTNSDQATSGSAVNRVNFTGSQGGTHIAMVTCRYWGASTWGWTEASLDANIYGLEIWQPYTWRFLLSGQSGTPPAVGAEVYEWRPDPNGIKGDAGGVIAAVESNYVYVHAFNSGGYGANATSNSWGSGYWIADSNAAVTNRWEYAGSPVWVSTRTMINEVEVWADANDLDANTLAAIAAMQAPTLDANATIYVPGMACTDPTIWEASRMLHGAYMEGWMADYSGYLMSVGYPDANLLRTWSGYVSMLAQLREANCNLVWWMPTTHETGVYDGNLALPVTGIVKSDATNWVVPMAQALHADGIQLYCGWRPRADITTGESGTMRALARALAASGIDGVAIHNDEVSQNSLINYVYPEIDANDENPACVTFVNMSYEVGSIPYDQIGHFTNIDRLGTEAYFTIEDARGHWHPSMASAWMVGGNAKRAAIMTMTPNWCKEANNPLYYALNRPVNKYGAAIHSALHGADAMAFWRLNYNEDAITHAAYRIGYHLLDVYCGWGGNQASVPRGTLILQTNTNVSAFKSAGYAYHYAMPTPDGLELGNVSQQLAAEVLLTAGLPYEVRFSNYPDDLPDSNELQVIVVPFTSTTNDPNAFPAATVAWLQSAADNGKRIVILRDANRGGTYYSDFTGYANLVASEGNVVVCPEVLWYGNNHAIEANILRAVTDGLGGNRLSYLNRYRHDVELSMTSRSTAQVYLAVTNWEPNAVSVDIGANLPAGDYWVGVISSADEVVRDRRRMTAAQIANMRVVLAGGESRIYFIRPAPIKLGVRP